MTTQPETRASTSATDSADPAVADATGSSHTATPGDAPTPAPQPCARCGGDAQFDFGELWLCLDCYHVAGSTCAGVTRPARPVDPVC